jgi:hypothetical protein
MGLMLSENGKLMLRNGKLFVDTNGTDCCCGEPVAGCCPGELIPTDIGPPEVPGTVLEVEVISDGTGCFTPGDKQDLNDLANPSTWSSNGPFMGNVAWKDVSLVCVAGDVLQFSWGTDAGCPITDIGGSFVWTRVSGACGPFEHVFSFAVDEDDVTGCGACNGAIGGVGLTGTIVVKVTIKP